MDFFSLDGAQVHGFELRHRSVAWLLTQHCYRVAAHGLEWCLFELS